MANPANTVLFTGRPTKDIELIQSEGKKAFCQFNLAINGNRKDAPANYATIKAFGKMAELLCKHATKGKLIQLNCAFRSTKSEYNSETSYDTFFVAEDLNLL